MLMKEINILHLTFVNSLNVIVIDKVDPSNCSNFQFGPELWSVTGGEWTR